MRRAFFLLSKCPAKTKKRAGKVPQSTAASEHTLLSKDVFTFYVRTGFRLMLSAVPSTNTEMGVVSDSYRISLIYSVDNFSIRTIIYIIAFWR